MIFICMIGLSFIMKPAFLFDIQESNAYRERDDFYGNRTLGYISAVAFSLIFAGI